MSLIAQISPRYTKLMNISSITRHLGFTVGFMATALVGYTCSDLKPASAFSCPAVGGVSNCNTLFTLNQDRSITTQILNANPYDGNDDNLVGFFNNSKSLTVDSIQLTGSNIFGFDGDGITAYGIPRYGSTGYEGPNTSFNITSSNSGFVSFSNPIQPGQGTYFSLEEAPGGILANTGLITSTRFTPEQKTQFNSLSANLNITAGATGTLAAAFILAPDPVVTKFGSAGFGITSGLTWTASAIFGKLALDPPDSNFMVIGMPIKPSLSQLPITTNDGFTQQSADYFNLLTSNLLQTIGTGNALITALNRADGALAAKNTFWENQQVQAAQEDTKLLSMLIADQPQLFADFANSISGIPNIKFDASQVVALQKTFRDSGFSPSLLQIFSDLGVDSTTQNDILQKFLATNPDLVAGLGNGDSSSLFANAAFASSLNSGSQALSQGVITNSNPTSVPEPFTFVGTFIGGIVAFKTRKRFKVTNDL